MKSSFCTIAFQKSKWGKDIVAEKSLMEVLPVIAAAGFEAAELWWPHVSALTAMQRNDVRKLMGDLGLKTSLISPYFDFTRSEESSAASQVVARRVIEDVEFFGGLGVRVFTGQVGSADASAEQWGRTAGALQSIADKAGGILLACETHARNLTDTVAGSLRLMAEVGRANVGLIYQPNTFAGEISAAEALVKHIVHVHMTNNRVKVPVPRGEGLAENEAVLGVLGRAKFGGYVSIEWMGEDAAGVAATEGPWLRDALGRLR